MEYKIIHGSCENALTDLPSGYFDSMVTDPPAGIAFMGKDWDKDKGGRDQWIEWMTQVMTQAHRVLKPGAHALIWALPRTSHWTATALEDAGFVVRDIVMHVFGSGFPKSHDVSKAIDKAAGKLGTQGQGFVAAGHDGRKAEMKQNLSFRSDYGYVHKHATPEAKQWQGWGTALKPACEHWILVRKPLSEKTVAKNVLEHGTGGINIDGCRVENENKAVRLSSGKNIYGGNSLLESKTRQNTSRDGSPQGRFPSHFICSTPELLDEQSGVLPKGGGQRGSIIHNKGSKGEKQGNVYGEYGAYTGKNMAGLCEGSYGASRFFYCAKASKSERNKGLENNHHPTVKSQKLMTYLTRLITPPGGEVLDPFMGSGSTGVAALKEGFKFTGIEQDPDYCEIARARLEHAATEAEGQMTLI